MKSILNRKAGKKDYDCVYVYSLGYGYGQVDIKVRVKVESVEGIKKCCKVVNIRLTEKSEK